MNIIKVHTTPSTNAFVKELMATNKLLSDSIVWAEHQTKGKGQMGNVWQTESGKNLTFSVLVNDLGIQLKDNFVLNMAISILIKEFLLGLNLKQIHIKWPNDILADKHKICGILIENICQQQQIKKTVIGIGINVNQQNFKNLPQASSLSLKTNQVFDLEKLLHTFVETFENRFYTLLQQPKKVLQQAYETHLFKKDKVATFQLQEEQLKTGIIKGVDHSGHLKVIFEDESVAQTFDLKEIKLLY
ncbi:biotin--[acetyl-CoA-carboxylase] ligase [Mesonia sp. K7]|uniref:biotin--[acetyl-CoA-carboxylase] ligase n=1 Tax=Mesonia sp. K7 TaxID=2218606 RepID=UPI000DA7BDD1|nr:biotin--[acetyl-CoA-carboxylase] ligase [Mesonia sp. K7]PZD78316.1 biotin--[acetyl-CoA-carboxylase] ligase [Mesonia sp. K7]